MVGKRAISIVIFFESREHRSPTRQTNCFRGSSFCTQKLEPRNDFLRVPKSYPENGNASFLQQFPVAYNILIYKGILKMLS